jgi:hypothetical protein
MEHFSHRLGVHSIQGYLFDGSGTSGGVSMVRVLSYVSLSTISFLLYNSSTIVFRGVEIAPRS